MRLDLNQSLHRSRRVGIAPRVGGVAAAGWACDVAGRDLTRRDLTRRDVTRRDVKVQAVDGRANDW